MEEEAGHSPPYSGLTLETLSVYTIHKCWEFYCVILTFKWSIRPFWWENKNYSTCFNRKGFNRGNWIFKVLFIRANKGQGVALLVLGNQEEWRFRKVLPNLSVAYSTEAVIKRSSSRRCCKPYVYSQLNMSPVTARNKKWLQSVLHISCD